MIVNPSFIMRDEDGARWYAYEVHHYPWGFIHRLRREVGVVDDSFEYHSRRGSWRNTYTSTYGNVRGGRLETIDDELAGRLDAVAVRARRVFEG